MSIVISYEATEVVVPGLNRLSYVGYYSLLQQFFHDLIAAV